MNPTILKIYSLQAALVKAGWFLLFFIPFWEWTPKIVWAVAIAICCAYVYLLVFGKQYDSADDHKATYKDFFSMEGIMAMFSNARVTATAWFHFLAFDLLVGLHIMLDAQQQSISHWLILPILITTWMAGPAGLLAYLVLRFTLTSVL